MVDIKDFEGVYQVSNTGKVKSLERIVASRCGNRTVKERILGINTKNDYVKVILSNKEKRRAASVHKLVAETFIPNIENKPMINHKNGIKHDNRVENLEWCTQSENVYHANRIGLSNHARGENVAFSKLEEEDVLLIIKLINRGCLEHKIADLFGIKQSAVNSIKLNKTWKHVDRNKKI